MNLQSEPVTFSQRKDPAERLWDYGATDAECEFLVKPRIYGGWEGKRVELNAMTSDRFVTWIERKLKKNGVEKVVPEADVLGAAWRRARLFARVKATINDIKQNADTAPKGLARRVREVLAKHSDMAWDDAIGLLADGRRRSQ
jgi:hypothetical protein